MIDLYPAPRYGKIIEPFAGSARYALKYWDRDVLLIDKYSVIVDVWHYLQQASAADIMGLPDMVNGQSVDDLNISQPEKWLIGFCINQGSAQPKKMYRTSERHNFTRWADDKRRIANSVDKIRHWKIDQGDYTIVANESATWFIDPPYQVGGKWYVESEIDLLALSVWSKSRMGQVIVCENTKANWLPFTPIGNMVGAYSKTTEAIWSNDFQQMAMQL